MTQAVMTWTHEHDNEMRALVATGKSRGQIAAIYTERYRINVTRNSIIGRCTRVGILSPKDQRSPEQRGSTANNRPDNAPSLRRLKRLPAKQPQGSYDGAKWTQVRIIRDLPKYPDAPAPLLISMRDLSDKHCKIVCEGTDDNCYPRYCGHQVVSGLSYCAFHARIVYRRAA
jgi:hypothetical protein